MGRLRLISLIRLRGLFGSTHSPRRRKYILLRSCSGEFLFDQVNFRVAGNTTISGTTYREVEIIATGPNGETFSGTYIARELEGGLYIARRGDGDQLYGFELKTSVSAGDAYVHTDERGNSYDVSVSEQTITVPAGTFEVLVYRIVRQLNGDTDIAYIAPGIGPVRIDFRGETYRLVSTNVN